MKSKLNLDFDLVKRARSAAKKIALDVQDFIDLHTTVTVERTVVRLIGIDGVDEIGTPLPNVVVDHVKENGGIERGIAFWLGNASVYTGKTPQEMAESVASGELNLTRVPMQDKADVKTKIDEWAVVSVEKIRQKRLERENTIERIGEGEKPYLYVIVATGNVYEDAIQA